MATFLNETTIILGAGVNKEIWEEIGVGHELIQGIADRVTNRTTPDNKIFSAALQRYFPELDEAVRTRFLLHLLEYMKESEVPSIDAFMQEVETFPEFAVDRVNFRAIGILMILVHVVGWEGETTVNNLDAEKNQTRRTWLTELCQCLVKHDEAFRNNSLKIVTFNYDRILEKYLWMRFGKQARWFIKENIYHVYGRLANLPDLDASYEGEIEMDFDVPNDNFESLAKLQKNIRLIRQPVELRVNLDQIKTAVNNAKILIVMGYGFDDINNRRIGLHEWRPGRPDQNLIVNVYPGKFPNFDFQPRRLLADKIRGLRIDTDIQYRTCSDFLKYALDKRKV